MGIFIFFLEIILFSFLFINIQAVKFCGKNYTTPTEGFKHKNCVPGHYEGSCLLLFSKPMKFMDALTTCHFKYGGRLATADSEIVFKKWIKRIYRDLKFEVKNETRFWIGYGNDSFYPMLLRGSAIRYFFDLNYWRKTFNGINLNMTLPWEDNADTNLLDNDPCSNYATVFNPNNAKFNIRSVEEKNPFLCETPRYPKFKCSKGWHFNPRNRMCVLVGDYQHNCTFVEAVKECRKNDAFMLIVIDFKDINYNNAVTELHGLGTKNDYLWYGDKVASGEYNALDGSNAIEFSDPSYTASACGVFFGKKDQNATTQISYFAKYISCNNKYPYICQRFVDQAFSLNVD